MARAPQRFGVFSPNRSEQAVQRFVDDLGRQQAELIARVQQLEERAPQAHFVWDGNTQEVVQSSGLRQVKVNSTTTLEALFESPFLDVNYGFTWGDRDSNDPIITIEVERASIATDRCLIQGQFILGTIAVTPLLLGTSFDFLLTVAFYGRLA